MTGAHFHLAFNHLPVVLVPVAVVMLSYAMATRSADLTKGALVLLIVSTLFGAAAFLTGEPAEEAVKQIAGVSTEAIEAHEDLATIAAAATALAGVFALVVLVKWRPGDATPWTMIAALVVATAAAVLLAWTAYLGGRIHHPELRDDAAATVSSGWGGERRWQPDRRIEPTRDRVATRTPFGMSDGNMGKGGPGVRNPLDHASSCVQHIRPHRPDARIRSMSSKSPHRYQNRDA